MQTAVAAHRLLDPERFLRVLDRVYAAACGETSWDRALEELCRLGAFGGCALSSIDPLEARPMLRAAYGLSSHATGIPLNQTPRSPLITDEMLRSMPGTVWHDQAIMPAALLAATPFWTDWMQPQGFVSWACVTVGRDGSQVVCLEIYDRRGGTSSSRYRHDLLTRLAPHLSRAWHLGGTARAGLRHGAALFSIDPPSPASEVAGAPGATQLRAEFGLTKAEARLALHLADGASLPSMAQAFDVKLTTIRSQLQQVFVKTGTSRQAELVALLLSQGHVGERPSPTEPVREASRTRASYDIRALQQGA